MKINKWISGIVLGGIAIFALLIAFPKIGLASANLAPSAPGLAISPGYSVDVDPDSVVDYVHTITNTGISDAFYGLQASASEGWAVEYFNATYPDETVLLLPLPLQAGESMTVGVRLTVPDGVASGMVNTTTVAVSVLYEGTFYLSMSVDDIAVVKSTVHYTYIYLPLVMRRYAVLTNGEFSDGLEGWTKTGTLGSSVAFDPNQPDNIVALLGNRGYACWGVPIDYGGIQQYFVVPRAPDGQSVHILFRYRIYTNDKNKDLTDEYDTFDVLVNDELKLRDANEVYFDYCNVPPYDLGWRAGDIDLGEGDIEATLAFEVHNRYDQWYNTYIYVDDVRLVVQ
jgi:hypothetical protein